MRTLNCSKLVPESSPANRLPKAVSAIASQKGFNGEISIPAKDSISMMVFAYSMCVQEGQEWTISVMEFLSLLKIVAHYRKESKGISQHPSQLLECLRQHDAFFRSHGVNVRFLNEDSGEPLENVIIAISWGGQSSTNSSINQ